ncbi:MAG: M20/M25/M40 family metallo-hydrolase [Bdellovibrionales bacterium]|nr:M20/M25/M40 family metallo-hydrolase [Bdellovibrionales bacterium]
MFVLNVSASEGGAMTPPQRLSKAIQLATVSEEGDPQRFKRFQDFLKASYPLTFRNLASLPVGSESLLLKWSGLRADLKPRLFYAHQDVVPVDPASLQDWTVPPFSGAIQDGFVWGRGSLDTKSQLIAILEATEKLLKQNFVPQRTLYFAFGHDEEVGGQNGAGKIAETFVKNNVQFDAVLDEGLAIVSNVFPGLGKTPAMIGIAQKGYATMTVVAKGSPGHSSMPKKPTAIERLSKAITEIDAHPFSAKITPPVKLMLENFSQNLSGFMKWALNNLWLTSKIVTWNLLKGAESAALVRTTLATTMISGGVKENVLPSEARATINLRILPGETSQSALAYLNSLVHDDQVSITLDSKSVVEPSSVSQVDTAFFQLLAKTTTQLWPHAFATPGLVIGQTDSRYFESHADNIYRFQPLELDKPDLGRVHGVNERIGIANFEKMIGFYESLFSAQE